jgi:hypothetical protein
VPSIVLPGPRAKINIVFSTKFLFRGIQLIFRAKPAIQLSFIFPGFPEFFLFENKFFQLGDTHFPGRPNKQDSPPSTSLLIKEAAEPVKTWYTFAFFGE